MASPLALPGDLECWLRAAWPPGPRGGIPLNDIASALDCSTSTLRRWIRIDAVPGPALTRYLQRRAFLLGKGAPRWPGPNRGALLRDREAAAYAERATATIGNDPLPAWTDASWDTAHDLQLLWWPQAHVYGVHVSGPGGRHGTVADLDGNWVEIGEIKGAVAHQAVLVHRSVYPSRHHAVVALHRTLEANLDRRCVAPETLVPQGRSHTLRGPLGGHPTIPTDLRRRHP